MTGKHPFVIGIWVSLHLKTYVVNAHQIQCQPTGMTLFGQVLTNEKTTLITYLRLNQVWQETVEKFCIVSFKMF